MLLTVGLGLLAVVYLVYELIGWQRRRRHDVSVLKISAYEQQRFTGGFCEGVSKAIAEIQFCRMSAAFTEIPISVPGEPGLTFADRFDEDSCLSEQVIKAAAGDWITAAIDDHRGFDKIHRRDRGKPRSSYSKSP